MFNALKALTHMFFNAIKRVPFQKHKVAWHLDRDAKWEDGNCMVLNLVCAYSFFV